MTFGSGSLAASHAFQPARILAQLALVIASRRAVYRRHFAPMYPVNKPIVIMILGPGFGFGIGWR